MLSDLSPPPAEPSQITTPACYTPVDSAPPVTAEQIWFMGLRLHNLHRSIIVQRVVSAVRVKRKMMVVNANAQMVVLAQTTPWIRTLFSRADIAFCDGAGVQLAIRALTGRAAHRTTPPEWIGAVLEMMGPDDSIFWIGGAPDVVAEAARNFEARYAVRTVGIQHGFFDLAPDSDESRDLVLRINQSRPSIILVNMGMPRQERWLMDNWDRLDTGVVITAGALVDHAAGRVSRPPRWVANLGVEWLIRLIKEPRRLWRRYLLGLPVFGLYLIKYAIMRERQNL